MHRQRIDRRPELEVRHPQEKQARNDADGDVDQGGGPLGRAIEPVQRLEVVDSLRRAEAFEQAT